MVSSIITVMEISLLSNFSMHSSPQRDTLSHWQSSPFSSSLTPWKLYLHWISTDVLFWIFYKINNTVYNLPFSGSQGSCILLQISLFHSFLIVEHI